MSSETEHSAHITLLTFCAWLGFTFGSPFSPSSSPSSSDTSFSDAMRYTPTVLPPPHEVGVPGVVGVVGVPSSPSTTESASGSDATDSDHFLRMALGWWLGSKLRRVVDGS